MEPGLLILVLFAAGPGPVPQRYYPSLDACRADGDQITVVQRMKTAGAAIWENAPPYACLPVPDKSIVVSDDMLWQRWFWSEAEHHWIQVPADRELINSRAEQVSIALGMPPLPPPPDQQPEPAQATCGWFSWITGCR